MVIPLILAAGLSSRMQEEKMLLPYKGVTLIEYTVQQVQEITAMPVVLVVKEQIKEAIQCKPPVHCCVNPYPEKGQASSLIQGLTCILNTYPECNGVIVFLGDQPEIDQKAARKAIEELEKNPEKIVACYYQNIKGHPTGFGKKWFKQLLSLKGDCGARVLLEQNADTVIRIKGNQKTVSDIDTKEDYTELLRQEKENGAFDHRPGSRRSGNRDNLPPVSGRFSGNGS